MDRRSLINLLLFVDKFRYEYHWLTEQMSIQSLMSVRECRDQVSHVQAGTESVPLPFFVGIFHKPRPLLQSFRGVLPWQVPRSTPFHCTCRNVLLCQYFAVEFGTLHITQSAVVFHFDLSDRGPQGKVRCYSTAQNQLKLFPTVCTLQLIFVTKNTGPRWGWGKWGGEGSTGRCPCGWRGGC